MTWLNELSTVPVFNADGCSDPACPCEMNAVGLDTSYWRVLVVHNYLTRYHRTSPYPTTCATCATMALDILTIIDDAVGGGGGEGSDAEEMDVEQAGEAMSAITSKFFYLPKYIILAILSARVGVELQVCEWCDDRVMEADGEDICESCGENGVFRCYDCSSLTDPDESYTVGYNQYCTDCASWCDECEEAYTGEECDGDCCRDCDCRPPMMVFVMPANGKGTVREDERFGVTLPSGMISDEGVYAINLLFQGDVTIDQNKRYAISDAIYSLDPTWQKKEGNFTRRLASALYKVGHKIPPARLSEIGNIAKLHTIVHSEFHIEFTRDLSGGAEEFCHEDSCWWGSYGASRCAFKSWGGLAMRTWDADGDRHDGPIGRAWVQPLNKELIPTHDALNPHAYLVYNGYGNLEAYTPARIIAHLAGMTYRKVSVRYDTVYVNGESGYLVSNAATCESTSTVYCGWEKHKKGDARMVREKVAADVEVDRVAREVAREAAREKLELESQSLTTTTSSIPADTTDTINEWVNERAEGDAA